MEPVNAGDFEKSARGKLSPMAYDYFASGADGEVTRRENRASYKRII